MMVSNFAVSWCEMMLKEDAIEQYMDNRQKYSLLSILMKNDAF